ncbi:thiopeptide-type bacteriocin biosynthesis protein [Actinophytocola sediminis]
MPADHIRTVEIIETAVVNVITGTPLTDAAQTAGMQASELADAVEVYQQAGRHALNGQTESDWWQVYIQFSDWDGAERAAAEHLAPLLRRAEASGAVTAWWFMRKSPCWRLRLRPGRAGRAIDADLSAELDQLTTYDQISRWWSGIYEAETAAFGGVHGVEIAHDLFCVDSNAILAMLGSDQPALGRRELSLLLCATLMRAANLEWYEQGDVWDRVNQERPHLTDVPADKITALAAEVKELLLIDTTPGGPLLGEARPLASSASWIDGFRQGGHALGVAAREGTLRRGLREIISYLVIFHWNRLGLHVRTQSILAAAAGAAILGTLPE